MTQSFGILLLILATARLFDILWSLTGGRFNDSYIGKTLPVERAVLWLFALAVAFILQEAVSINLLKDLDLSQSASAYEWHVMFFVGLVDLGHAACKKWLT